METMKKSRTRDYPQSKPKWSPQFEERVKAARRMLLAGYSEREIREVHGSVVLKESRNQPSLRKA